MREIKFRLIKNGKIVGYEWHRTNCNGDIDIFHSTDNEEWFNILFDGPSTYIRNDGKEQFTGPRDVNGVEIYEGDILKITGEEPLSDQVTTGYDWEIIGEVCFANDSWMVFEPGNIPQWFFYTLYNDGDSEFEIIGNIHTNPELLEEK